MGVMESFVVIAEKAHDCLLQQILEWLLGHGCDRRDVVDTLACTLSITYYNMH